LSGEDEFVALEETSGGVHEDAVGDAVGQISDADSNVFCLRRALDGDVENDAEGFQRKLVDRIDLVEVVQDEVKDRGSSSGRSIQFSGFVNFEGSFLRFSNLDETIDHKYKNCILNKSFCGFVLLCFSEIN